MGEVTDAILEGDLCQICGEAMDGDGFPQTCEGCKSDEDNEDDSMDAKETSIQQEFEQFMAQAFDNVEKTSDQWKIMELVWHSAACFTSSAITQDAMNLPAIYHESNAYCLNYIKDNASAHLAEEASKRLSDG